MYERRDMLRLENMWLWYLHPEYPKNLVHPAPYLERSHLGLLAWYVREMEARKSKYKSMLNDQFDVLTFDIDQPDWSEVLAASYGLTLDPATGPIVANENKATDERLELEQTFRDLFAALPG